VNRGALAAFIAAGAVWLFCVLASGSGWHSAITGPAASASAVVFVACAVWLNWSASTPGAEDDPGDDDSCHHNHPERGQR
jgi:hypothetical protein